MAGLMNSLAATSRFVSPLATSLVGECWAMTTRNASGSCRSRLRRRGRSSRTRWSRPARPAPTCGHLRGEERHGPSPSHPLRFGAQAAAAELGLPVGDYPRSVLPSPRCRSRCGQPSGLPIRMPVSSDRRPEPPETRRVHLVAAQALVEPGGGPIAGSGTNPISGIGLVLIALAHLNVVARCWRGDNAGTASSAEGGQLIPKPCCNAGGHGRSIVRPTRRESTSKSLSK